MISFSPGGNRGLFAIVFKRRNDSAYPRRDETVPGSASAHKAQKALASLRFCISLIATKEGSCDAARFQGMRDRRKPSVE